MTRTGHLLNAAAIAWFCVAAAGQVMFVVYMAGFYGPTAISGDYAQWTRNDNLIDGYKAGDTWGNLGFISHILFSFVLTATGIAQFIPALRRAQPNLHRWCGRVFIVSALIASLIGFALVWGRGTQSDVSNSIAISGNGVLIIAFAVLAWRAALRRNFKAHEAWAFRLWLAASGVWFLRLGMVVYGVVTSLVLRLEEPRMDIAFAIWGFGSYLAPLLIYEMYRGAKRAQSGAPRYAMAAVLAILTLATALGAAGMSAGQWIPLILAPDL